MHKSMVILALCVGVLAFPSTLSATPPTKPGHRSGILLAEGASGLSMTAGKIRFVIDNPLSVARVDAEYTVANTTSDVVDADLTWAFTDLYGEEPQPLVVTMDGQLLSNKLVVDADLYRPGIENWLTEHPALDQDFRRLPDVPSEDDERRAMSLLAQAGTGSASRGDAQAMIRFTRGQASRQDLRALTFLLRRAEWDSMREAWAPWISEYAQNIYWVKVHVSLPPGTVRTVHLSYSQEAWPGFRYEFLVAPPSAGWQAVGPLAIGVALPQGFRLSTNMLVKERDGWYDFDLSGRPTHLSFGVVQPAQASHVDWVFVSSALVALASVGVLLIRRNRRKLRFRGGPTDH